MAAQTGCVERRITVRSNPPGAQLFVDDYEIGTTPVAVDFTYYGTRKMRLVKDGYETAVINQPIPAPWYQYFPFDFVTENLVPGQIRDERVVTYQMQPAVQVPTDQLMARADALRLNGRIGAAANAQVRITPPPASLPSARPPLAGPPPAYGAPFNTLPAPTEAFPPPRRSGRRPPTRRRVDTCRPAHPSRPANIHRRQRRPRPITLRFPAMLPRPFMLRRPVMLPRRLPTGAAEPLSRLRTNPCLSLPEMEDRMSGRL